MGTAAVPHSRRAVQNMLTLAGGHLGSTFILLATTPYFLHALGSSRYGLMALFSALIQYAAIVDFGLGPSLVKYIAEDHAKDRCAAIRQMMTFAILFYLVIGSIVFASIALLGHRIIALIKMPSDLRPEAFPLLLGFAGYFFVAAIGLTLYSLLSGIGRLDLSSNIKATGLIFYVLSALFAVHLGFGMQGILASSYIMLGLTIPLTYYFARRNFGNLYCSPTKIEKNAIRRVFVTGGWIQISSMMALIYSSTSGVIIGVVVNVAAVAIYDLASRLSRSIRAFAYYSTAAMLPAMSSLEARRGSQAIHRALIDGSRYVSAVSFCVCGFVIASAPIIFSAWLGSRAPQRALLDEVLIVLCLSAVIDNYVNVSTTVLRAIGAPKLETLYTVATAIVSICIAISLAPRFGVIGVVLGPLVGSTVGSTLFMIAFSRTRNLPLMSNFGKPLLKIIAVTTVSASLTYVVVQPLLQNGPPSRPLAFVEIIIVGSLYLAIFTIMLGITKYLGDHDLAFVKRILPKRLALAIDPRLIRFLFVRTIP